jgi:hypothetical protein
MALHRAGAHAGTKTLGQAFGHVFTRGVVDDVFGLDDLARHVVEVAGVVGQAQAHGLFAVPVQAREGVGRGLQARHRGLLSPPQ